MAFTPAMIAQANAQLSSGSAGPTPSYDPNASWADAVKQSSPQPVAPAPASGLMNTLGQAAGKTNQIVSEIPGQFAQNLNQAYASAGPALVNDVQQGATSMSASPTSDNKIPAVKGAAQVALRTAGDAAGAIFAPFSAAIQAGLQSITKASPELGNAVSGVINNIADKISNSKALQDYAIAHPNAGEDFNRAVTLALSGEEKSTTKAVGQDLANAAPKVENAVTGAANTVAGGVKNAINTVGNAIPEAAPAAPFDSYGAALKDVTPPYDSKMVGNFVTNAAGERVPAVTEGEGVFGSRQVTQTPAMESAAKALNSVPGYADLAKSGGTALEKLNIVYPEIAKEAQAMRDSLKSEGVLVPPKELVSVVNDAVSNVPKESLILQKADPAIKQYLSVTRNAVSQAPGTLEGVLDVRQALDDAYENARGKMAYGSDKLSALDQVHTAGRDALNKYLIDHAVGTDVKAALQRQFDLYRAFDQLRTNAESESTTEGGRFLDRHPGLKMAGQLLTRIGTRFVAGSAITGLKDIVKGAK